MLQLAPPPTILQDFEYHWKHVKNFYATNESMPKVHVNNTNLPGHLEEMLNLLIEEENLRKVTTSIQTTNGLVNSTTEVSEVDSAKPPVSHSRTIANTTKLSSECFNFILTNRPLDLLTDIYFTDSPPGSSVCVLNWIRRFLSCLQNPHLDHASIFQPIQVSFFGAVVKVLGSLSLLGCLFGVYVIFQLVAFIRLFHQQGN